MIARLGRCPGTLLRLLPSDMADPMRRTANKGLMIAFINADLFNRAGLDVHKSIVLYDEDGLFEYAVETMPDAELQAKLIDQTAIRYWSKGI